jgi:hypothetical protein
LLAFIGCNIFINSGIVMCKNTLYLIFLSKRTIRKIKKMIERLKKWFETKIKESKEKKYKI